MSNHLPDVAVIPWHLSSPHGSNFWLVSLLSVVMCECRVWNEWALLSSEHNLSSLFGDVKFTKSSNQRTEQRHNTQSFCPSETWLSYNHGHNTAVTIQHWEKPWGILYFSIYELWRRVFHQKRQSGIHSLDSYQHFESRINPTLWQYNMITISHGHLKQRKIHLT